MEIKPLIKAYRQMESETAKKEILRKIEELISRSIRRILKSYNHRQKYYQFEIEGPEAFIVFMDHQKMTHPESQPFAFIFINLKSVGGQPVENNAIMADRSAEATEIGRNLSQELNEILELRPDQTSKHFKGLRVKSGLIFDFVSQAQNLSIIEIG